MSKDNVKVAGGQNIIPHTVIMKAWLTTSKEKSNRNRDH